MKAQNSDMCKAGSRFVIDKNEKNLTELGY